MIASLKLQNNLPEICFHPQKKKSVLVNLIFAKLLFKCRTHKNWHAYYTILKQQPNVSVSIEERKLSLDCFANEII